jgi:uncharacterized protein YdgA (DUF945 family)
MKKRKVCQMKKVVAVLVLLLIVLGAAWAGSSYWFGMKAEEQYRQLLAKASPSPLLKFSIKRYDRGIFSSTARVAVEFGETADQKQKDGKNLRVVADQAICHGPFPLGNMKDFKPVVAVIRTTVQSFPELMGNAKEFFDKFPELKNTENRTTVFLSGETESDLTVPAFRRPVPGDKKIDVVWEGLSAHFTLTEGLKSTTGSIKAPGLQITDPEGSFTMKGAQAVVNLRQGVRNLNLGDISFEVSSIDFKGTGGKEPDSFSANRIKYEMNLKDAGNDCIDAGFTVRVDQAKTVDKTVGPAQINLVFRKLDAESIEKFQAANNALQLQPPASAEEVQQRMLANYMLLLGGLIKKSPELELTEVKFAMPEGNFSGKAKVVFIDPKGSIADNPLLLLNSVVAEAECSAQESLARYIAANVLKGMPEPDTAGPEVAEPAKPGSEVAESEESGSEVAESEESEEAESEAPKAAEPPKTERQKAESAKTAPPKIESVDERVSRTLDQLVQQDLIVKDGGNYKSTASYRAGKVVLNGRTIPLEHLFK